MTFEEATAVEAGEAAWVEVEVCRDLDGSRVTLDAYVVEGASDGPTLWCQGALHGDQPVGARAVREFVTGLDPAAVAGTVVGLPVANPPAFRERARGAPVHLGAADVDSVFPGSATGTFPQRLAATLFEAASAADLVVDLQSADDQLVMHASFAYVPAVGGPVQTRSREAAVAGGVAHVVELDPAEMGGFFTAELARRGTPALAVESGGGARTYDWAVEDFLQAIVGIGAHLGVLPSSSSTREADPTFHEDLSFLFAGVGGFVDRAVSGGQRVEAGDHLATVTDLRGETEETFEAPFDGHVLAVRTYPTARPGDLVVELAPAPGAGYTNRP